MAAARRVGGVRGVGGGCLLLVEVDGGMLSLELGGGDLLECLVVGFVALVRGAGRRGKEAEGVSGRGGIVHHVAALALEEGHVARVRGALKH